MDYKYLYIIVLILLLDAIWIGSNIKMYSDSVKKIQGSEMITRYHFVLLAYIVVVLTTIFITIPFTGYHINENSDFSEKLLKSFIYGGGTGFAIYAIYNLTCLSIYHKYDVYVAIKDTLWGTFLNTIITFIYFL